MSKNRQFILTAQLEHQQAIKAMRKRSDQIWTIIMVVMIVGITLTVVFIQISHHW